VNGTKPIIAVDIDDVLGDSTEAVRLWGNAKAGVELTREDYKIEGTYWQYYEQVWKAKDVHESLSYEDTQAGMITGEIPIPLMAGASFAISELQKKLLITARETIFEEITQKWVDEHFEGQDIELYFAMNPKHQPSMNRKTKGELCRDLGAFILIDDNVENCESALEAGVEAILFGNYGWQVSVPEKAIRCKDWPAVLEYFDGRQ
jgi:uncharacterized HAD superfamily protein